MLTKEMVDWLSKEYDAVSFEQWFVLDENRRNLVLRLKKFLNCSTAMAIVKVLDKIAKVNGKV